MKINDVEFDFNATKLENLKKIDECMPNLQKALDEGAKLFKQNKMYEGAKRQIDAVKQFFIDLVGVDIVKDCDDIALAVAFVQDFNIQVDKQREKVTQEYFKRK